METCGAATQGAKHLCLLYSSAMNQRSFESFVMGCSKCCEGQAGAISGGYVAEFRWSDSSVLKQSIKPECFIKETPQLGQIKAS